MSWDEIKKGVNSDLNVPLNHLIWLNDYKTYGEDSYVFQNKDILHELYRDYKLSINDNKTLDEVIAFVLNESSEVGKCFGSIYGVSKNVNWSSLRTLKDVIADNDAINALFMNSFASNILINNDTARNLIISDRQAFNALFSHTESLNVMYDNSAVVESKIFSSEYYLDTVTNNSRFEVVTKECTIVYSSRAYADLYSGKCIVVGVSQNHSAESSPYFSFVVTKGSDVQCGCNQSYGTGGMTFMVNRFAPKASMCPAFRNGLDSKTTTANVQMAILKIE